MSIKASYVALYFVTLATLKWQKRDLKGEYTKYRSTALAKKTIFSILGGCNISNSTWKRQGWRFGGGHCCHPSGLRVELFVREEWLGLKVRCCPLYILFTRPPRERNDSNMCIWLCTSKMPVLFLDWALSRRANGNVTGCFGPLQWLALAY